MGNELYEVGDSVLLTAGRPVPVPEQPVQWRLVAHASLGKMKQMKYLKHHVRYETFAREK